MYTRICGVALTRKDNFAINPGKMILKLQTNVKTSDANVLRKPPEDNLISPKYIGIILIKIFRYIILSFCIDGIYSLNQTSINYLHATGCFFS